jgi:beta-xylosidase
VAVIKGLALKPWWDQFLMKHIFSLYSRPFLGISSLFLALSGCTFSPSSQHSTDNTELGHSCPTEYQNPLIWQDLPDLEVIRVDNVYYYTASTFHHSPGAPLLRSYDLVNWEYVSHSVPVLDFDPSYDLAEERSYVNGIWASTLRYRQSNQTFYWMGCMHNKGGSYVFTAKDPQGPWQKNQTQACYYDMGLLIEQDTDKMYVAWGNNTINVAELSADGLSEVRREVVLQTPDNLSGPLEGSRFYKIDGNYYIWLTQYANGEYVARSTNGPFGPYELRPFAVKVPFDDIGAGHSPHQGGIVQTQKGDWYYIAFNDSFPGGRLPVMAPMHWVDGWPVLDLVDGKWATSYPFPDLPCGAGKVKKASNIDNFLGPRLHALWEWNHNPENSHWAFNDGLVLQTASVTDDLYAARNTLTRRIAGPSQSATIKLDVSKMHEGDVAGLAIFRDSSAWIGIKKYAGKMQVVMTTDITLDAKWNTDSIGEQIASEAFSGNNVWFKAAADIRSSEGGGFADFYYSTDGVEFKPLGQRFIMKRDWPYFLGYRFALFNYATESLGGQVSFKQFAVELE